MGEATTAANESGLDQAMAILEFDPFAYRYDESLRAGLNIVVVVNVFICLLGIFGNILIICVFGRRVFTKSSTALLLQGLACTDMLTLIFEMYTNLTYYANVEMYQFQIIFILAGYCNFSFALCSNWTLVVVTAERVTAILLPHKSRLIWTWSRCAIILVLEFLIVFLANLSWIVPWSLSVNITELVDVDSFSGENYSEDMWVQFVAAAAFPGVVVIIGNGIIIWQLLLRKKLVKNMSHKTQRTSKKVNVPQTDQSSSAAAQNSLQHPTSQNVLASNESSSPSNETFPQGTVDSKGISKSGNVSSSNPAIALKEPAPKNVASKTPHASVSNTERCQHGDHKQPGEGSTSTSKSAGMTGASLNAILMFISLFFLITNIPITVYVIYLKIHVWPQRVLNRYDTFLYHVIVSLPVLNFSINIIGYSIAGRRFRGELKAMLISCVRCCF